MKGNRVQGVEYLERWNVYQVGRNPSAMLGGYGGSPGDAKANAMEAKQRGDEKSLCP